MLDILISVLLILRASFILSLLVFPSSYAFAYIHRKISEKHSWVFATFVCIFLAFFSIFILAYLLPWINALTKADLGIIPEELAPEPHEIVANILFAIVRIAMLSFIFSALTLPFAFISSYVYSFMLDRKFNKHFARYISILFALFVFLSLVVHTLPYIIEPFFLFLYAS